VLGADRPGGLLVRPDGAPADATVIGLMPPRVSAA
jgi:hypothetical protein